MIRGGAQKAVPSEHWKGRRDNARAFHEAARIQLGLLDESSNANPVITLIATAAIGYADAVTSRQKGIVNQEQHDKVVSLLRAAVGNKLPLGIAKALTSILKEKATSQYGVRHGRKDTAAKLFTSLEDVANWVERHLIDV